MFHAYSYAAQQAHQHLSKQIEQFLSRGGKIEEIPSGTSGSSDRIPKAPWQSGHTAKALKNDARQH